MQIAEDAKRVTRTIASIPVLVPQPYGAGHVLTEAEAAMLNQTFSENISNNMRAKAVRVEGEGDARKETPLDPKSEADVAEFQRLVDEYVAKYEPGVRASGGGGGSRTLDPVEKEVRAIAEAKLAEVLKAKGLKRTDVNFTELRDKIISDNREKLEAQARKIVAARDKASDATGDILASVADGLPGIGAGEDNSGTGGDGGEQGEG